MGMTSAVRVPAEMGTPSATVAEML